MERRYVVVEGCIGVGKSTLCRVLRDAWGAELVMEPDSINPFLELYYRDPARYAFPVQMFYLITRWRQQQAIRQPSLFTEAVVSDYAFAKDRLFAEKTLEGPELELYDHFAGALGQTSPVPDLLIYLHAPIDALMGRIAERGAPGEERIAESYLVDLIARYEGLLAGWSLCPVLRIDNRDMDYARDPDARARVLEMIEATLSGRPVPGAPGSAVADREVQPSLFGAGTQPRSTQSVEHHRVGPSQEEGR